MYDVQAKSLLNLWNAVNHVRFTRSKILYIIKVLNSEDQINFIYKKNSKIYVSNKEDVKEYLARPENVKSLSSLTASVRVKTQNLVKTIPFAVNREFRLMVNLPTKESIKNVIDFPSPESFSKMNQDMRSYQVIAEEDCETVISRIFNDESLGSFRAGGTLWKLISNSFIGVSRAKARQVVNKQEIKQLGQAHAIVSRPIQSMWPNEHWQIDVFIMSDARASMRSNYKNIWRQDVVVIIDHFSKYVWARVVNAKDDPVTNELKRDELLNSRHKQIINFLEEICNPAYRTRRVDVAKENMKPAWAITGRPAYPRLLQGDREFAPDTSKYITEWCAENNVIQSNSKPFSPNTQGLVERVNKTIKGSLKSMLFAKGSVLFRPQGRDKEFEKNLADVVRAYNAMSHNITQGSPHKVYFGRDDEIYESNLNSAITNVIQRTETEIELEKGSLTAVPRADRFSSVSSMSELSGGASSAASEIPDDTNVLNQGCRIHPSVEERLKNKPQSWEPIGSIEHTCAIERCRSGIMKSAQEMLGVAEKKINRFQKSKVEVGDIVRLLNMQSEETDPRTGQNVGDITRKHGAGDKLERSRIDESARAAKTVMHWSRELYVVREIIPGEGRDATRFKVSLLSPESGSSEKVGNYIKSTFNKKNIKILKDLRWCYYRKDILVIPPESNRDVIIYSMSNVIQGNIRREKLLKMIKNIESTLNLQYILRKYSDIAKNYISDILNLWIREIDYIKINKKRYKIENFQSEKIIHVKNYEEFDRNQDPEFSSRITRIENSLSSSLYFVYYVTIPGLGAVSIVDIFAETYELDLNRLAEISRLSTKPTLSPQAVEGTAIL